MVRVHVGQLFFADCPSGIVRLREISQLRSVLRAFEIFLSSSPEEKSAKKIPLNFMFSLYREFYDNHEFTDL